MTRHPMNRRLFLSRATLASGAALAALASPSSTLRAATATSAATRRAPRVLLRNSWQSVNIGDIGHTPGALRLFDQYFPEAEITLWYRELGHGAREMLAREWPRLKFVAGAVDAAGKPSTPELARAWAETDIYVSGSGSGFPRASDCAAFHRATRKPIGVIAVSTDPISGIGPGLDPEGGTLTSLRDRALKLPAGHLDPTWSYVLENAAFFFCRDTISRDYLKAQGAKTPILDFGPDGQLGMHLRDDAKGFAYLKAQGLEEGKFVCVLPRLRYTPYYQIHNRPRSATDEIRDKINARTVEPDHVKLRDMMISYVRQTGNKVLACPEMTYEIQLSKEYLVDPLPADVKKNVVWRDSYWLPDEAASVYAKALAVVSIECHSPLIALHNGTPTIHIRNPTDTCKGQMYRDIGAGEWFFEIDETSGAELWSRLEAIHRDPAAAKAKVKKIMQFVESRQKRMIDAVRAAIA